MNRLYVCAYRLQKLRPRRGKVGVHIVTESIPEAECRRMFSPWSRWVKILSYGPKFKKSFSGIVLAPTDDYFLLKAECEARGLQCIGPDFGQLGTLDNDLIREVSFFDFEFSGLNEWDGAPVVYSATCLQQLSSVHSRKFFPEWAFDGAPKKPLTAMDIGCGPISLLRWGAIHGYVRITGVDPLLNMYDMMLARHGLDALPMIRCANEVPDFAENLDKLPAKNFDVVFTQNALDHTQQPKRVVELMAEKLRPGGHAIITVGTREGTRQAWDQLHKTDIFLDGELMFQHQHTEPQPLLPANLRLDQVHESSDDWLSCRLVKV